MDAGPILRDIMMGRFWDGGAEGDDSIFSDIAVGEPSPTTDEERGGAQYEPTGLTPTSPTRSSKSRRQSRPNYAVLAGDRLRTGEACELVPVARAWHRDKDLGLSALSHHLRCFHC
uniref:Creb/atf bzip transcription factor n=1 Tax=Rhipicephalus zambeziensis TaxID=60191 RepID=A0A224YU08_9ACAR